MKFNITNTLHALYKNGENAAEFKNGINSILPFQNNKYIINEQLIRGDRSSIHWKNSIPNPFQDVIDDDVLKGNIIYMDDIIFDIENFKIIKNTRGTFDPIEFQNGNYISYTRNRVVLKLDPENGGREILVNYRKKQSEGGNLNEIPQLGATFYYLGNRFIIVNGESPENLRVAGGEYLKKNTIFQYSLRLKKWVEILDLGKKPILTIFNDQKLIVVSNDEAFEIEYNKDVIRKYPIPVKDHDWFSIGELENSYLISGLNKDQENSIFLASKDFSAFKLIRTDSYFYRTRISTKLTLIAPKKFLK